MKQFIKCLLIFVTALQMGYAQVKTNLELLDIFNMEYVSDPQISPDGNQVVYVRNFKDVMTDSNLSNLWIVNYDGSRNRPLTTGNQNDHSPVWSHDGEKIVFKSNKEDDKTKLYLMWMDTKEIAPLTNTTMSPGSVSWSNDDKFLAFNMFVPAEKQSPIKMPSKPEGAKWNAPPIYIDNMKYRGDGQGYIKPGNMQLFTLSVDGGTPRQLTNTTFDHGAPVWSKTNTHLLFSANFHKDEEFLPADSEVYELALNNGNVKALTKRNGSDNQPAVSPDGSMIAYTGFDDALQGYQLSRLYVMNADGTNSRLISKEFDREVENIHWDKKGNGLYFQYDDRGNTKLAYMNLKGEVTIIAESLGGLSLGRPYNAASFSVSSNDKFAYTLGSTKHLADLAVSDSKKSQRLTALNDDLFSFRNLGKVQEMWWESSYDKRKI